jgi:exo-poly-alpha-galacturonosidase
MKTTSNTIKDYQPQNLMSPPGARTEESIALIWDKPLGYEDIAYYNIYMDGQYVGIGNSTDFTITDLQEGTSFLFTVRSVLKDGSLSKKSNEILVPTLTKGEVFDITLYGAVGDGKTLNTAAIQQAIDACTSGGCVYIPEGLFLTGALFLKSDMTLYLAEGSTLLGSDRPEDYPVIMCRFEGLEKECYASLINGGTLRDGGLSNVKISGHGRIDGNGSKLLHNEKEENKGGRGRVICFRNSNNIYIHGITVTHSPAWCVHFIYCEDVSVNNVKIYTRTDENGIVYKGIHNGDGLNPDSSRNVYIFNSMIASQDDCIAIKSGRNEEGRRIGRPSDNIRITNCRFKSGLGVAIGSEMSGGIRNVLVGDCIYEDVYSIASIKAPRGRGNVIENIRYEDIRLINHSNEHKDCCWFRGAIYIDHYYSHNVFDCKQENPFDETTPVFRDIYFKNITLETVVSNAIYMTALPESPFRNIRLENVKAIGKHGFIANNIEGLILKDVSITAIQGEDFVFWNVNQTENEE